MFLLSSRVESVATSSISENKDLALAVDTVVAKISEDLVYDVSRGSIDPNQYADYPDPCNPWLACLEPYLYSAPSDYRWRQISDIYGNLYNVSHGVIAQDLHDYNDSPYFDAGTAADADGDGISDSIWVQVQSGIYGVTSSKGKPIYAAVRVIDNGGMLNVNTGYKFDSSSSIGKSQIDINLMALSWRPNDSTSAYQTIDETRLLNIRSPANPGDFPGYESDVVWRYESPYGPNTPFDISDELEMRYRFVINQDNIDTRLEDWGGQFRKRTNSTPYGTGDLAEWFKTTSIDANLTAPPDIEYAYRHIATTYNCDRIIKPNGEKMFNISLAASADANTVVYDVVRASLDSTISNAVCKQIAANLKDYVDNDANITVVYDGPDKIPYFGFEQPCIYISEIVQSFVRQDPSNTLTHSYAIELYKPYATDPVPDSNWRLDISSNPSAPYSFTWPGNSPFFVFNWTDVGPATLGVDTRDSNLVTDVNVAFTDSAVISLKRIVDGLPLTVDFVVVPTVGTEPGWLVDPPVDDFAVVVHSFQRDISPHKCIRRLWENPAAGLITEATLGGYNTFFDNFNPQQIQAHPKNGPLTNIGELGQLFFFRAYGYDYGGIPFPMLPAGFIEPDIRLNLTLPEYQGLFNYFTLLDPTVDGIDNDSDGAIEPDEDELKIKGRININTAPWFVLAQLPWVSGGTPSYELAQAIVAYRDKNKLVENVVDYSIGRGKGMVDLTGSCSPLIVREDRGFVSIGELMNVTHALGREICPPLSPSYNVLYDIRKYADPTSSDLVSLPDLSPNDGAANDFEERDIIFDRISNLVTVRSDVFTAYILVRIGPNGPQKRAIAILDRSGVTPAGGKVKIVAIQMVPDPR